MEWSDCKWGASDYSKGTGGSVVRLIRRRSQTGLGVLGWMTIGTIFPSVSNPHLRKVNDNSYCRGLVQEVD